MKNLNSKHVIKIDCGVLNIINDFYVEYTTFHKDEIKKYMKIYNYQKCDIGVVEKKHFYKNIMEHNTNIKKIIKIFINETNLNYDVINTILDFLPKPKQNDELIQKQFYSMHDEYQSMHFLHKYNKLRNKKIKNLGLKEGEIIDKHEDIYLNYQDHNQKHIK